MKIQTTNLSPIIAPIVSELVARIVVLEASIEQLYEKLGVKADANAAELQPIDPNDPNVKRLTERHAEILMQVMDAAKGKLAQPSHD